MMDTKFYILLIIAGGLFFFSGCLESMSYERSVSLLPAVIENADPNAPAPEAVDPLDVLVAAEKIAAKAGLKPYSADEGEASLLDIADTDLTDETNAGTVNVTEYKHPDLPVYLTVTRKSDEILILLNHAPDAGGKPDPAAQKLFASIQKQLLDINGH